jgi:thiol-disulfide isomerase/thioredoxin
MFPDVPIVRVETGAHQDLTFTHLFTKDKEHSLSVVEFWTPTCTRCPMAMDKFQIFAADFPDIHCATMCLGSETAAGMIIRGELCDDDDGGDSQHPSTRWSCLDHYCVKSVKDKENLKNFFGFSAVPHILVLDKRGCVMASGGCDDWPHIIQRVRRLTEISAQ